MTRTDQYEGMVAEVVTITGHGGDDIHAYVARPLGGGAHAGVVLMHHYPGWDEWYKEQARRFAHHGYFSICPDLYCRMGHGEVDDMYAQARAEGGPPDDQAVGDAAAAAGYLRGQDGATGKVGIWGTCSGGRHAYLAACRSDAFDACVNLWGGGVVAPKEELSDRRPVAPVEYTPELSCPVLGLFGNEDQSPTAEQVDVLEEELKRHGKEYEFHRYDGAGHGFFYYDRPAAYRGEQAVDGWEKVWAFFGRHLGGS
jgi:carboxymethylenebutenolidase